CGTFHVSDFQSGAQGDSVPLLDVPMCSASGGALDAKPPTFASNALLCTARLAGGCKTDEVCAAKPPPGFVSAPCIYQSAAAPCPPRYTLRTVYFSGTQDTRACAMCSCGPANDAICTGVTLLYANQTCDGNPNATVVHGSGDCVIFNTGGPNNSYKYQPDPGP